MPAPAVLSGSCIATGDPCDNSPVWSGEPESSAEAGPTEGGGVPPDLQRAGAPGLSIGCSRDCTQR